MKKVFFTLAIAGMFGFAACNNNNAPEATEPDTTVVAEPAMTEPDTTAVQEVATEETAENAEVQTPEAK